MGELNIAVGAGGVAAWLASTSGSTPTAKAPPQPQMKTVEVLVAKADIPLGQKVEAGQLQWQSWPAAAASSNFIRRSERPDAMKQLGS
jgi:pilus assembly protein CpaB